MGKTLKDQSVIREVCESCKGIQTGMVQYSAEVNRDTMGDLREKR